MKTPALIVSSLLLPATLLTGIIPLSAQDLACRAASKAAASPSGRVEAWPALSDELFIGPDARAALLSDGSAVVLDRATSVLVEIDRASGRVTTLAHKGEGPGEIKGALSLLAAAGDTIAVIDLANHRVTRWTRAGRLVSSHPYRFLPLPIFHWPSGDGIVEVAQKLGSMAKAEPVEMSLRLLQADTTLMLRSLTLPDPPTGPGIFSQSGIAAPDGSGHLLLASGASADLTVIGVRGGADRVLHLMIGAPIPTDQAMATRLVTLASSQIPAASRQELVQGMLRMVPINPTYPLFSRIVMGTGGAIWVQRTFSGDNAGPKDPPITFSMNDLSGYRWEQFSPTGARLGDCMMPEAWRVLGVGPGWVLFANDAADNTQFFTWRPR